jgi:Big-like domain-containing protein
MTFRLKKTWVAALGVTVGLTAVGGLALADDPPAWYTGGNSTVADPYNLGTGVPLKLYDAAGTEVTTGTTTAKLGAFAAATGTVRASDDSATLFVHLLQTSTAPGDWPGVQVTGTDKFTGPGSVTAPGSLSGKPLVRTDVSGEYTLADVIAGLPNNETADGYAKVYELRLRTGSAAGGVSDSYASEYIKVTGSTWTVTTAPVLTGGGPQNPTPVNTSVSATWPATLNYGSAASVGVTVSAASGSAKPSGTVKLVSGTTTLATATLSAAGTATLALTATALPPGATSLKVTYAGVASSFNASESTAKSLTVGKATASAPTYKTTKAPTSRKKGSGTVTITAPAGLAPAGGSAVVTLTKGKVKKTISITIVNGTATVKLPKLTPGKWTVTVSYAGDSHYQAATSASYKLKVKAAKPK